MTHNCHNKLTATHSRPCLWARLCGVFTIIAVVTIASCSQGEHSGYASVAPDGWIYGDSLTLLHGNPDTTDVVRADIAVALRHCNSYEYSNIWLSITYANPDSIVTDTFAITLADDFGNWLGQGMGVSYQQIDTVLRDVAIDLGKPVKINHIMRTDTLRGIEQAGVMIIEKMQKQ